MPGKLKQEVIERIDHLYETHQKLTASIVFDDATQEKSPLHSLFEWDKDKAFIEHNLNIARRVIRRYNVMISEPEDKFYHVPITIEKAQAPLQSREGQYIKGTALIKQQSAFDRALGEAFAKLKAARLAVDDLEAVSAGRDDDSDKIIGLLRQANKGLSVAELALSRVH